MAIRLLQYQPVRFRTTEEIEEDQCSCSSSCFCQLVNKNDLTQWQMVSLNLVANGTFDTSLDDWNIGEALTVTATVTNETEEDACDGEIDLSVSGGTGPYEYSIDGATFLSSNVFEDLCAGCYNLVVKDSVGNLGFYYGCVDTNVDCSIYNTPDLYDLENIDISKLLNCELNDLL